MLLLPEYSSLFPNIITLTPTDFRRFYKALNDQYPLNNLREFPTDLDDINECKSMFEQYFIDEIEASGLYHFEVQMA